jgi:tetratricopeptide (TPR) repeat protein
MKLFSLIFACLAILMSSCAQLDHKRDPAGAGPQFPEQLKQNSDVPETKKELMVELESLVEKAQKAGTEDVKFLSSDFSLKAHDASLRGDAHTAAHLYDAVHKMNPDDAYIKRKLAVELIKTGQLKRSKTLLSDIYQHQKEDNHEVIGLVLAGVHTALGESKEAVDVYQSVLKSHPKSEEACVFLAKAYISEEKDQAAHKLLSKCQNEMPQSPIFTYYQGKVHLERGDEKKAVAAFRESLERSANYHQAVIALGAYFQKNERHDQAVKEYKKFLDQNPMNYPVLGRLVQLLFTQAKYDEIIPYAERLSSLDSKDINLKVRLGILYTDAKRYGEAKGVFKEVLVAIPDSDRVLFYLGSLYQETQKYDEAITYFSKIDEESPLFHDGHLQIAHMLHAMAADNIEHEKRFTQFVENAIEDYPNLAFELKVVLTSYYERKENFSRAIATLESLDETENFSEGHRYYLAALYDKQGQYDQAISHIKTILNANPEHAHALNFLGYTMIERGEDLAQAYSYIKKAVKLMPEDGYIRDSLGWYYYNVGQYQKALSETKKAWELVQSDVMISKHLGLIYQKLKKYEQAEKHLKEALRIGQTQNEKDVVQKALEGLQEARQEKRLPASNP